MVIRFKSINYRHLIYYLANLVSAVLLMSETSSDWKPFVLVLLSMLMITKPLSLVPMLFVSSWSISFVAYPGLAAFFYYLALFFISIFITLVFSKRKPITFVSTTPAARVALWFAIWVVFTGYTSVSGAWYDSLKLAFYIIPIFIVAHLHIRGMDYCRTSIDVIAAFFSMYCLYIALFAPVNYYSEFETVGKNSLRSDLNPNTAAQFVLLLFTILYCETFRTKRYGLLLFAAMDVGTLMYLGSRTAFFTMAIIAVVYLLVVLKTEVWKKILLFAVFLALFFALFSMGDRFARFERLSVSAIEEDRGSGRLDSWQTLFKEVIPYHLVKGVGLGRENYENLPIYALDADNLYVDLLTATGIVGLLLFFSYFTMNVTHLFRYRKKKRDWDFLIAIFLAYLFEGIGETVYDIPMIWFMGLLSILAINDMKYSEDQNEPCITDTEESAFPLIDNAYLSDSV